jgi:hypothetical protein
VRSLTNRFRREEEGAACRIRTGDRGFESFSLQRRVACEPEFSGRASHRPRSCEAANDISTILHKFGSRRWLPSCRKRRSAASKTPGRSRWGIPASRQQRKSVIGMGGGVGGAAQGLGSAGQAQIALLAHRRQPGDLCRRDRAGSGYRHHALDRRRAKVPHQEWRGP